MIPNPVVKSRFSLLARAGTASSASAPPLTGVGFYRPLTTEWSMISLQSIKKVISNPGIDFKVE